jgi:hypothetical protein
MVRYSMGSVRSHRFVPAPVQSVWSRKTSAFEWVPVNDPYVVSSAFNAAAVTASVAPPRVVFAGRAPCPICNEVLLVTDVTWYVPLPFPVKPDTVMMLPVWS